MSNYHSFSASVQGASHVKKKIVMQDASGNFEDEKVKLIALSDGHGDSSCFRSDRGSKLIVDVGIAELKRLPKKWMERNTNWTMKKAEKFESDS